MASNLGLSPGYPLGFQSRGRDGFGRDSSKRERALVGVCRRRDRVGVSGGDKVGACQEERGDLCRRRERERVEDSRSVEEGVSQGDKVGVCQFFRSQNEV
ncbi:hypothetical protein RchiOBHm_Chr6g0246561 [Rosa chinensis]|uniref:Uncharacterized protein n=1 Tax=Rosa chinensis TaxID=74649 RepID=A0A2P6PJK0_ROSCH|nr:hypothetical protein RchiOBHm_Chr6g0246561 [Rosa chinensis]